MIIEATKEEYPNKHDSSLPPNTKMICSKPEAKKLHYHLSDAYDHILSYWENHWHKSKYSDFNTFIKSNLLYSPLLKKTKYSKGKKVKVKSKEIKRLTHHKDWVATHGKYYTHYQIFEMLADKILQPMPGDHKTLQDVTEPMYRRFNAYIEWCKEWDLKHNNGLYTTGLNDCKVKIKWLN